MDQRPVRDGVDESEAEVLRARLSFEQGLRQATVVGSRAARRMVTPALIGVGLAGGALLVLALVRLARRPAADGALIRIVIEPPRSSKKLWPAIGGSVARWLLERQLRADGPLRALASAVWEQRGSRHDGSRPFQAARGATARDSGRFGS
jgi:hypothetical protein